VSRGPQARRSSQRVGNFGNFGNFGKFGND
jgi:hypothetical protein